jgi:hypothetical protein
MARTPTVTRGIQFTLSRTGLWTQMLTPLSAGQTLTRVRGKLKAFFDPAPVTATSTALTTGWAWGLYTATSNPPVSPLDPYGSPTASWVWHDYTLTDYDVLGGNNIITTGREPIQFDVRAQRTAPVGGAFLFLGLRTSTLVTDGWSASIGFFAVLLQP